MNQISNHGLATPATLLTLLQHWAESRPDAMAFDFLPSHGELAADTITYAQLHSGVVSSGECLKELLHPGERIVLMFPAGTSFLHALLACFYAGVIAVPVVTPHHRRSLPRLSRVLADSGARHLLTTQATLNRRRELLVELADQPHWLTIESLELAGSSWAPVTNSTNIAFIQYTSGSTGEPKGVVLSHENLISNIGLIASARVSGTSHRLVCWLPAFHDWGLIGFLLHALYSGTPCTFMDPLSFLERPLRWLEAISRTRATFSGGPNFAYQRCIRSIPPEDRLHLDLSCWESALVGAEPVYADTLREFAEAFAVSGFRSSAFVPCYGLAENTLWVSGTIEQTEPTLLHLDARQLREHRVVPVSSEEPGSTLVGCGRVVRNHHVLIVDPDTLLQCQPDRVGEVWVSGPSVAQGYWQNQKHSQQAFDAYLADTNQGPFLRTGDLGFMHDGQVFITGRLKDLLIIAGRNFYPQDIERSIEACHPDIRPGHCAAFSVESDRQEHLVVMQEVALGRRPNLDAFIGSIQMAIMQGHGLSAGAILAVRPGTIPLTSSGKIRRSACRDLYWSRQPAPLALWQNASLQNGSGAGS